MSKWNSADAEALRRESSKAIRAFERLGYRIKRQGKHVTMTNGETVVVIPRNNPINPYTMGVIIQGAGLTVEEFKKVL